MTSLQRILARLQGTARWGTYAQAGECPTNLGIGEIEVVAAEMLPRVTRSST